MDDLMAEKAFNSQALRIAFLGNFGVDYSSETHHARSLEALGHFVVRLQEREALTENILTTALECDVFVWVHTHGWEQPTNNGTTMSDVLAQLRDAGVPSLGYHLDLYMAIDRWNQYKDSVYFTEIDHFFTVESQLADWLNANTRVKGHYLQAGVFHEESYMAAPQTGRPTKDVIFVGSHGYHPEWPYRPQLINWLRDNYGDRFGHYSGEHFSLGLRRGEALNQLLADTKVVIGDSLCIGYDYPDYWSDRVYETLGRGGFIIHPYIKGMGGHFEDGKHLKFYNFQDFGQLKGMIDYYLEHDDEREAIRRAGHEHVAANHTYKQRWAQIIEEVTK